MIMWCDICDVMCNVLYVLWYMIWYNKWYMWCDIAYKKTTMRYIWMIWNDIIWYDITWYEIWYDMIYCIWKVDKDNILLAELTYTTHLSFTEYVCLTNYAYDLSIIVVFGGSWCCPIFQGYFIHTGGIWCFPRWRESTLRIWVNLSHQFFQN